MKDDKLAAKFRTTFRTQEGADVLEELRREFYDTSLITADPIHMAQKVGAHGVIRYILDVLEER